MILFTGPVSVDHAHCGSGGYVQKIFSSLFGSINFTMMRKSRINRDR